jgi:hypothetical protein
MCEKLCQGQNFHRTLRCSSLRHATFLLDTLPIPEIEMRPWADTVTCSLEDLNYAKARQKNKGVEDGCHDDILCTCRGFWLFSLSVVLGYLRSLFGDYGTRYHV